MLLQSNQPVFVFIKVQMGGNCQKVIQSCNITVMWSETTSDFIWYFEQKSIPILIKNNMEIVFFKQNFGNSLIMIWLLW